MTPPRPAEPEGLAAALVAALGELREPTKAGHADTGNYSYAYMTLPQLLAATRPVFAAHGLAVTQTVQRTDVGVAVTTIVLHESGDERICPSLELRCGPGAQDTGSAITYARRYTLAALTGLAGDDDDDGARAQKAASAATKPVTAAETKRAILDAMDGDKERAAAFWADAAPGRGPFPRALVDELVAAASAAAAAAEA